MTTTSTPRFVPGLHNKKPAVLDTHEGMYAPLIDNVAAAVADGLNSGERVPALFAWLRADLDAWAASA